MRKTGKNELILSEGWFRSDRINLSLYRFRVSCIEYLDSLIGLREFLSKDREYFVILSYDLSSDLLELPLKRSGLPRIVLMEIGDPLPEGPLPKRKALPLLLSSSSLNDGEFMDRVREIRNLIAEGTVYQVNLTNRFDFSFGGDTEDLFFQFYRNQPVPYAFYFRSEGFTILSGSMELFLERRGKIIRSKPIKGTSRRKKSLFDSEKDRAENLMITDMMRNDLGRIAEKGSVQVPELFSIVRYRTLYQMHSTVEAKTDRDFVDIISATFPPASVTGAPKKKAVEVIDKLEPHPRSFYCGCAGIIHKNGDFVLSVLIRIAIARGESISYYAGCGIVWDSEPERELEELYLKLKAFADLRP